MHIKSYFVRSVDEAIVQARAELGEDALLLSTRKADAPDGSSGGYDVVFGSTAAPKLLAVTEGPPQPASIIREALSIREGNRDQLTGEMECLLAQLDEIHSLLLSSGFDAGLASEIVEGVEAAMSANGWESGRFDRQMVYDLLRAEFTARVKIDANLGVEGSGGTVVALVGPGGAGKTTTLMKIAAFQAASNLPVRILTLDGSGLGSRMQLQLFARKTGIAFAVVEAPETLPAAVESARKNEIVLIDTPSCASAVSREGCAEILANCPGIDVHLVLPGYMTSSAMREAIRRYKLFRPSKLLLTKRDETTTFGTGVSEAVRAGLSISLIANGVWIPEDLYAASVEDWMPISLGRERAQRICA